MMFYRAIVIFFGLIILGSFNTEAKFTPTQARPYFMPRGERERIHDLIQNEAWAKADYARVKKSAEKGNGYWSAFLYALEGNSKYLPAARAWLLEYGKKGGDISIARDRLNKPGFFKGGQPWISPVYYNFDISHLVAYDWVYRGLTAAERKIAENGIMTSARFRMRCMDRWSQTPNLVFKPTFMVAIAGLVTANKELLDWGFHRKAWSTRGGYFPVLNLMLRDGGPWAEAPIYPVAHKSLLLMCKMSKYQNLLDGKDWFSHKSPSGGSPKGLMDYFIDTAYPIERTGYGYGQIRVATYGDGATSAKGDLFLVNPAGRGLNMHKELAEAYSVSGDLRYAEFLKMAPDYKPNLVDRRPLPPHVKWPDAPSKVWPKYGMAMLRSDESPSYWTNEKAIAVFHVMSQGYGHDHRDKFSIMLHGADRLLYPDYNAVQYENPAVGWTRNSVAHNILIVDEQDTRNAPPTDIRHEFTPEVKFLATSASGVFEGVDQTRALLLTPEYLLDVFHAGSNFPHTYDYLLHSFGKPEPVDPAGYEPSTALIKRYWRMEGQRAVATNDQWSLDFVIDEDSVRKKEAFDRQWLESKKKRRKRPKKGKADQSRYGPEWYAHRAAVRVTMAGEPQTLVAYGTGPQEVPMLVVRRASVRNSVFVATHEPFADMNSPQIRKVTKLAQSNHAILVRVEGKDFIDYAGVAFGPASDTEHVLVSRDDQNTTFAFKNYGYLRITQDGRLTARGNWTGFRIPEAQGPLVLNGRQVKADKIEGYFSYGNIPDSRAPALKTDLECPLLVKVSPAVIRLFPRDTRPMNFAIKNVLKMPVSGRIEFDLPKGLIAKPVNASFGPVRRGNTTTVPVTFNSNKMRPGKHTIAYRVRYRPGESTKEIKTATMGMKVTVGPVLESIYQHPNPSVYLINAPKYTAKLDMFQGLLLHLADDADTVMLDGSPLFIFSDGQKELLFQGTDHAFTWPREVPASLLANVYDRARYKVIFLGDRFIVIMDRNWTQFERAYFTVPGQWVSQGGTPKWSRIVAKDNDRKEVDAKPGTRFKVVAAELAFPRGKWSICFQFKPAQKVSFNNTGMKFSLGSLTGDQWIVGFCKPGELDNWRWK